MATQALYLDSHALHCEAELLACFQEGEHWIAVLDKTVFHPQGGGQPGDTGRITTHCGERAQVLHTKKAGDIIQHVISQPLPTGTVTIAMDKEPRNTHSILHSLGHLIGNIGQQNGWQPEKAHHWPNECRVEFSPREHVIDLDEHTIQQHLTRLIAANLPMRSHTKSDGTRWVAFGDLMAWPCGGTHVAATGEIPANIQVSTKLKKGKLQVRYQIADRG